MCLPDSFLCQRDLDSVHIKAYMKKSSVHKQVDLTHDKVQLIIVVDFF